MRPRPDLALIVITDQKQAAPRSITDIVRAALQAGAPAVQLRDKTATARTLLAQAETLRAVTHEYGALLFVNDRLDVALAAAADGVHLGPDDLPLPAARAVVPEGFLIGVSTDQPATALQAQRAGADYIGCGAVFGTASKDVGAEAVGVEQVGAVARAVHIPVIGIGGVTPENAGAVAAAGAAGTAVIGAVMKADDVADTVRTLLRPFRASR